MTETVIEDWAYQLPPELIAARPPPTRDGARLMVLRLEAGIPEDAMMTALPSLLRPGDLLVANNSAVVPARVRARRRSGGQVELLFLEPGPGPVRALVRPLRRLDPGEVLDIAGAGSATILTIDREEGIAVLRTQPEPLELMLAVGEVPLPPYLGRSAEPEDVERYQTVYAGPPGSSAAPTAGLHFTPTLLAALKERGVGFAAVTLHVGLGTFRPVRPEDLARGELHAETWAVSEATAEAIHRTKVGGGRLIAVGTTAVRALHASLHEGEIRAGAGSTRLFLRPPDRLVVDGLITNFHLPRSSLLMLVACLVGRQRLLEAYDTAVARRYRFYSYGDAMLLV